MLERDLVRKIIEYLRSLKCVFAWKEHGGMYGTSGVPDIICCRNGRFVAFEVKVKPNKPTRLQEETIRKIREAGGVAEVVFSLEEAKRIMEEQDNDNA